MTTLRTERIDGGIRVWDDRDPDTPIYLHRMSEVDPSVVDRVLADRQRLRAEMAADARWDRYVAQARAEIEAAKAELGPDRLTMTDAEIREHLLGQRPTIFEPRGRPSPDPQPLTPGP